MRLLFTRLSAADVLTAAATAAALGGTSAPLAAQIVPPIAPPIASSPTYATGRDVRVGDRARIRTVGRDANGWRVDCEGRVTAIVGDTVVIENASRWSGCPRKLYDASELSQTEFAYRSRGSRVLHTVAGTGIGAAVGVVGGLLSYGGTDCAFGDCDEEYAGIATVLFGMLGGAAGGVIGLLMPAGPRWEALRTLAPVRVAGLAVRPSVRLRVR